MTKDNDINVKITVSELLRNGIHYTGNKGPTFGVRHVQVVLSALGLGIVFSDRTSFPISIIAMTDNSTTNAEVPVYDWNNRSVIISAIFWGAICLPLISGYFGKQYGAKWFMFGAGITNSLMFLLIPLAAAILGSTGVIICRLSQGLAQGMLFPLNTCVLGNWVPTEERSRMGFFGTAVITISIVLTSIATGYISTSSLGWPWVFYIFGGISLAWCILVGLLAEHNPATHSKITPEEKKYIQISLNQKMGKDIPIPWKDIFTCIHVWAILVAQIGFSWIGIILSTEMSIFMTNVMEFGIKSNGFISALPSLCGLVSGLFSSILSDFIPRKKILSVLNSRRVFHTIGITGISLCLIMMTFVPAKHSAWAVLLICIGNVFLVPAVVGGSDVNTLDLSPMFAGIIFGCYNTVSQSIALAAPFMVQWIITNEADAAQWRTIFILSAVIAIGSALFFDVFASATRQNWDGETEKEATIMRARKRSSVFTSTSVAIP